MTTVTLKHTKNSKTWFVSRHLGAKQWAIENGFSIDYFVEHLDESNAPKAGDTVIGTLPIHLIAQLNKKGVRFLHLRLNLDSLTRGRELTSDELKAVDAKLEEFLVWKLEQNEFLAL